MIQEKIYSTYQWVNTWLPGTKKYCYFDETKSIKEISLNIFDHYILRKVFGCYKKTHLSTVLKEVYCASLGIDEEPLKSNDTREEKKGVACEEKKRAFLSYEHLDKEYKDRMKNLFYKANESYLNNKNRDKFIEVFTFNKRYTVAMHCETVDNEGEVGKGRRRVKQVPNDFFISTVQFKITRKGVKDIVEDASTKISMSKFEGHDKTSYLRIPENSLKGSLLANNEITPFVNTILHYTSAIKAVLYRERYEENEKMKIKGEKSGLSVSVDTAEQREENFRETGWGTLGSTSIIDYDKSRVEENPPLIHKPISLDFIYPLMASTQTRK